MLHYLTILRPANGVMSMIAVWIGAIVAGGPFMPGTNVLLGALSVFLISGGGMVINDYFDAEIDRINKPGRPIPSGKIEKSVALAYAAILFAIGIALSYLIRTETLVITLLSTAFLIWYAAKIKKTILMGNILVSALVGLTFIYGGAIYGEIVMLMPLALLAFLSNVAREIYKTVDDAVGDQKYSVNSVAIKMGVLHARLLGNIFITSAVIFSFLPYFIGILNPIYLYFVLIADMAFIATILAPAKYGSKLLKIAMFIALIAFVAGAIRF